MPTSAKTFDLEMKEWIFKCFQAGYRRFLDIGAGSGKYANMFNEIRHDTSSDYYMIDATMQAIEPDPEYIVKFDLHNMYDFVYVGERVEGFIQVRPNYCTDVVILGDVLEHLPKSAGIDVIEHFLYRSHRIVAIVPLKLVQLSEDHIKECHNSLWNADDFLRYQAVCVERHGKIRAHMPGLFSRPTAVIAKSSNEILKEHGVAKFRGTILDRG